MFWNRIPWHHRHDLHLIDHGCVGCPRQHRDVDIEHCYLCTAFDDLVTEDGVTYLACSPVPERSFPAVSPF